MRIGIGLLLSATLALGQLRGVVDAHTHGAPDSQDWKIDVLETARLAKAEGMRAIVLKSHNAPTAQLAYLVGKLTPGIEVYGGIALNRSVGGLNPAAIETQANFTGHFLRIVWFPTYDAENNVRGLREKRPWVSIAKDGRLTPEATEVLRTIQRLNLVMATGHSSAEEDLLLVAEARKMGIQRMVVTHPLYYLIRMSIPQMQRAAQMGAYLELCGNALLPATPEERKLKVEDYAKTIHAVGAEHLILSSDLGQTYNPVLTEGWKIFVEKLRQAGVTQKEIDTMARRNPAKLLGLE